MSAENIAAVQELVADHMDAIHAYFKPGVRVTVIVRTPGYPKRDFLMTGDDMAEIRALVDRRAGAAIAKAEGRAS